MAVSERFRLCLRDLSTHCESLCAENERLRSQNRALELQASPCAAPGFIQTSDLAEQNFGNEEGVIKIRESWKEGPHEPAETWKESTKEFTSDVSEEVHMNMSKHLTTNIGSRDHHALGTLAGMRLGMLTLGQPNVVSSPRKLKSVFNSFCTMEDLGRNFEESVKNPSGMFLEGQIFEVLVRSVWFRSVCMLIIAANTIYIGISADRQVKNSFRRVQGLQKEPDWKVPDVMFAVWFSLELLLRVLGEKKGLFLWRQFQVESLRWRPGGELCHRASSPQAVQLLFFAHIPCVSSRSLRASCAHSASLAEPPDDGLRPHELFCVLAVGIRHDYHHYVCVWDHI